MEVKVSVLMPTYNHVRYISQAIDSFLDQHCDFEVELIISDDCSTDGTMEIAMAYAEQYPREIKLIRNSVNQGLLRNYKTIIEQARGKYFAILESDDYWIDHKKLQKQVNFLEKNKEYGLVFSSYKLVNEDGRKLGGYRATTLFENAYESLLKGNTIAAVTVCFSRELYERWCDINEYIASHFKTFDLPVWLSIAAHSKIYGMLDTTAVYRKVGTSISNNYSWEKVEKFNDNIDLIIQYIIDKYGHGSLSSSELQNALIYRRISEAIDRDKYKQMSYYARQIIRNNVSSLIVYYFPYIWYFLKKIKLKITFFS